jgi:hypothetical protein
MSLPKDPPAAAAGSQQSFKTCVKCNGHYVVVASDQPGTPPREFKVICR